MTLYAILIGSAPEDFRQKKLEDMSDFLNSKNGRRGVVTFANGITEQMLEMVLDNSMKQNPDSILLYLCTLQPVGDDEKSVWLGGEEIRRDVISHYQTLAAECGIDMQVIFDSDRELVSEEENPDIRFSAEVLSSLINFMEENKDASYVLPKVVYPDGKIQYLCKLLPTPSDLIFRRFLPKTKWTEKKNDRYCLKSSGYDKVINPPCLSGCFMFMRLSVLAENNIFFDDSFFMYFEDFDLIRRLHRVSKTLYFPNVQIVHDHQKASYKNRKMLWVHIRSAVRYFGKYGWWRDKERREMNERILREIEGI